MGLLDNMGSFVRRGTDAAGRAAGTANLKMQLNDLMKRRQGLAAQLGASLYESTREIHEFRAGREQIYDDIEAIDRQRESLEQQLAEIEAASQAAQMASVRYTCPRCGASVYAQDSFCSGCGLSIAEVKSLILNASPQPIQSTGMVCPGCGAPINEDDVFCMNCGKDLRISETPEEECEMPGGAEPDSSCTEGEGEAIDDSSSDLPIIPQEIDATEAISSGTPSNEGYCPNCGNPIEAGQVFCGICGSKIQ